VQGGGCCEAHLHGIEVFKYAAIFRYVILLPAETQFIVRHFPIKQIAAVAFVNYHQVVLIDRRRFRAIRCVEDPLDQALNSADVDFGFGLGGHIGKCLETEDVCERFTRDDLSGGELTFRLIPKG
jgi:hypothetical protein